MKISVLIPAYNEEHSISSCLNSLVSVAYSNKEIIVIDDASTDHTVQVVEKYHDKGVVLVRREKNGGRAAALNSGLRHATGDIIVTTDADTIVPLSWLQSFRVQFEQKGVIAVGGAYQAHNKDKPLVDATSVLDQIMNGVFKKSMIPNKLSGVNSAIRKDVLQDLGGFDENSWWSEDSELGWKLSRIGTVVYNPENIVSTQYPETWSGVWKRKYYWGYAMGLKFRERMQFNIKLWIRPLVFIALFTSLLVSLAAIPRGGNVCFASGMFFLLLLSSLTIVYIPLGIITMKRYGDRISLKTVSLLAVVPIVREFAYVYGMSSGFCKGRVKSIKPSWKK